MLYIIFFTLIVSFLIIGAVYIKNQTMSKVLVCICAAFAVIMIILFENSVGATEHYNEIKLLPNGQYYKVIEMGRGADHSSFTIINENKEEVIWKYDHPKPKIIYTNDYTGYAEFKSYNKLITDLTLYLPDPHCKACGEEQITYTTYCGDCGQKMWYTN